MQDRNETRPSGPRIGREGILAAGLWGVLTALGELAVWNVDVFPGRYSESADIADDAFLVLTRLAVPVFAFVIAVVAVSLLRFHSKGRPRGDGDGFRGTRATYVTWLGVTGGLAVLLIFYPGIHGVVQLDRTHDPAAEELVVRVEGARWAWTITYPEAGVTTGDELVIPADRQVRFEVTSVDVLHSFWIPAFRAKIDAVPGLVTRTVVTATETGSFEEDPALRIQCAELCGLAHSQMAMPVRVLAPEAFDAWLAQQAGAAAPACSPNGTELTILAKDIAFDRKCLAVPADTPFTITLDNQDPGIPHNLSIAEDPEWTRILFTGELFDGVAVRTYQIPALPAGVYTFRCDVHPIPAMTGTFVVGEPAEGEG